MTEPINLPTTIPSIELPPGESGSSPNNDQQLAPVRDDVDNGIVGNKRRKLFHDQESEMEEKREPNRVPTDKDSDIEIAVAMSGNATDSTQKSVSRLDCVDEIDTQVTIKAPKDRDSDIENAVATSENAIDSTRPDCVDKGDASIAIKAPIDKDDDIEIAVTMSTDAIDSTQKTVSRLDCVDKRDGPTTIKAPTDKDGDIEIVQATSENAIDSTQKSVSRLDCVDKGDTPVTIKAPTDKDGDIEIAVATSENAIDSTQKPDSRRDCIDKSDVTITIKTIEEIQVPTHKSSRKLSAIDENKKSPHKLPVIDTKEERLHKLHMIDKEKENFMNENGKQKLKFDDENSQGKDVDTKKCDSPLKDSSPCDKAEKSSVVSQSKPIETRVLNISLIPKNRNILSDYNLMLTENIEFFEVPTSYSISDGAVGINTQGLPTSKVGLRCIHCPSIGRHVTAASFFPSSITSIASGVGTIGARHFAGGKCPYAPKKMLELLKQNKKVSQQQTRMQGRIGLDAHCKALSKQNDIKDHAAGGIQINASGTSETTSALNQHKIATRKRRASFCDEKQPCSTRKVSNIDRNDPSAFIEGDIEHFWECKHCNVLPNRWRASGSVVFSAEAPTFEMVRKHLSICQGKVPLLIPHNATITTKEDENGPTVLIRWESDDKSLRKSGRIKRRLLDSESVESIRRKRSSSQIVRKITADVEHEVMVLPEDKPLTTDFAHFIMLQLKKCYLTKPGGSRANCPLGYPGLACKYCVGTTTARRFFYTSADHLRNSFSHIPSHLASCTKCPNDVKQKIEEFKVIRSKQKSQLKNGYHKQFIDRVWERLHGPGGGIINDSQNELNNAVDREISDDDSSVSSISRDKKLDSQRHQYPSIRGLWLESDHISIERPKSVLVHVGDRKEVVDYTYYSMLQMAPKKLVKNKKQERKSPQNDIKQLCKSELFSKKENQPLQQINTEKNIVSQTEIGSAADATISEEAYTLVCKYCDSECEQNHFSFNTADDLHRGFPDIPKHLFSCENCPNEVKENLKTFKDLRATQEAFLKHKAQKKFMTKVWSRLERHFTDEPSVPIQITTQPTDMLVKDFSSDVTSITPLLTENDRKLVTQFTFFTMEQMKPTTLQKSGNGARSMFQYGFPGLCCIHCADTPSARNFFYRTADILSGNYAHIPNHVLSCKHCPSHIKRALADKKRIHANEKIRLHRGSQRVFFNNVWDKLHCRH
jgi:hypothetical protein